MEEIIIQDSDKDNSKGRLPLEHMPGETQADFGKARLEEDGLSYYGSFFGLEQASASSFCPESLTPGA